MLLAGDLLRRGADPARTAVLMEMLYDYVRERGIEAVEDANGVAGMIGHA